MTGGNQTRGPSPGERDQKELEGSLKVFSQRWSWCDYFFLVGVGWNFSGRGRTYRGSHPRSSNYCVCDRVVFRHSFIARTFFWCTFTARTLRTFSCVLHTCMAQGCLQCACRHLSVISPSPFSCFTHPCSCCSLTVTSRPLPTTTSPTLTSTTSCRTFPT